MGIFTFFQLITPYLIAFFVTFIIRDLALERKNDLEDEEESVDGNEIGDSEFDDFTDEHS